MLFFYNYRKWTNVKLNNVVNTVSQTSYERDKKIIYITYILNSYYVILNLHNISIILLKL